MSILSWVVVGLIAGLVARLAGSRLGLAENLILAIVGSTVGGWSYTALSDAAATVLSPVSLAFGLLGAGLFLALAWGISERRPAI